MVAHMLLLQEDWKEMHDGISKGLLAGWIQPIVCKEYKLEEAGQAHEEVINNSGTLGKRVLVL